MPGLPDLGASWRNLPHHLFVYLITGQVKGSIMGRHAAPRTSSTLARRATAVSAGTFVLCLGGVAPALAGTTPPPIPKPISDAVQQVSNVTGLPNPLPPSEGAARHHQKPAHSTSAPTTGTPAGALSTTVSSSRHPAVVAVEMPSSAFLTRSAALPASSPAVASPTRIQPSSAMQALPAPLPINDAPRILLVAVATMVLGALAGGHIKAAQHYVFAR
jgi:hypothetical protein